MIWYTIHPTVLVVFCSFLNSFHVWKRWMITSLCSYRLLLFLKQSLSLCCDEQTHTQRMFNRTSLGPSRTEAKDTILTALWWRRCLRSQLFLTCKTTSCRFLVFFCPRLQEDSVLRVWIHQMLLGSVCLDCLLLLFLPWHQMHQPTKSLSNQKPTYLDITIQHSPCWENLITPRFSVALCLLMEAKAVAWVSLRLDLLHYQEGLQPRGGNSQLSPVMSLWWAHILLSAATSWTEMVDSWKLDKIYCYYCSQAHMYKTSERSHRKRSKTGNTRQ